MIAKIVERVQGLFTPNPYKVSFETLAKRQKELDVKSEQFGLSPEEQTELQRSYIEIALALFRWDISLARKRIEIVSGWLSPVVYNEIAGDLARALDNNPELAVKIVTGPTILMNDDGNRVWEMFEDSVYGDRLQIQPNYLIRGVSPETGLPLPHFRIIDRRGVSATHLLIEDSHRTPDVSPRMVHHIRGFGNVVVGYESEKGSWARYFQHLWQYSTIDPQLVHVDTYRDLYDTLNPKR